MGHPARKCPKGKGGGKSKGSWSWGKGTRDFKVKGTGSIFQVDRDDVQGYFEWNQPEEEKPSKEITIDQDGYELVKRPKIFAHFLPDIYSVDADIDKDSSTTPIASGDQFPYL